MTGVSTCKCLHSSEYRPRRFKYSSSLNAPHNPFPGRDNRGTGRWSDLPVAAGAQTQASGSRPCAPSCLSAKAEAAEMEQNEFVS